MSYEGVDTAVRPIAVTVLAGLAVLNALAAGAAGVATLAGWSAVFEPGGLGPNRIAPAALLGPLAPAAGFVLLGLSGAFAAIAYGLIALAPWVRVALSVVFGSLGAVTVMATAWGIAHGEPGVIVGGLLKLAAIGAVVWYLNSSGVRAVFAGSRARAT